MLTHTIVHKGNADTATNEFRLTYDGNHIGRVLTSSTGNCQLSSYKYFNTLLNYSQFIPFETFRAYINKLTERKILLIDINSRYLDTAIKYVGEENIINKMEYLSTNKSNMVIVLIKVRKGVYE